MDKNTTGMETLVIIVHKKYDVVLFEGTLKLKLHPDSRIQRNNPLNSTAVQHNQGCSTD